jgi:hypothetical protein
MSERHRPLQCWLATLLIALCGLLLHPAQAAEDAAALLRAADRWRIADAGAQVETRVQVLGADGAVEKERLYTVFVQPGHRSLVLMRSPAEAGQRVLMLGDDFWLLMPASQRPLRITPLQKLLGDASTGDIATLSWAEDYTGTLVGEESCEGQPCRHLQLRAARPGVSYQRMELWLGQARGEPLRAELYVQSDKLAKRARFVLDRADAPTQVAEMVLQDELSHHRETRVRYLSRTPRRVPDAWMNPMFLVRNPGLE